MVAQIKAGDSVLSFQQRIEEAGFPNVTVTPLGGDRVLLNCTGWEVFSKVLKGALDFFGMLFCNFQNWSESLVRYERGAWLRVYGIPVHAWNDNFFRLCVSGFGRFLYVDKCTADKARLDFARVLVVTPEVEILNKLNVFIIDGRKYDIKIVEEWGCNLGEDSFMSDEEIVSIPEEELHNNDVEGLDEVQGEWELDDLVTDLQNEWCKHDKKSVEVCKYEGSPKKGGNDVGKEFFAVPLSPVLQPVTTTAVASKDNVEDEHRNMESPVQPCNKQGPWSIDWMENQKTISEGGVVFSSTRKEDNVLHFKPNKFSSSSTSCNPSAHKKGGVALPSVGFMKKIARLPARDRKQILHLLDKQKRNKKKKRAAPTTSKPSEGSTSNVPTNSNSTGSVQGATDWVNWLHLNGKADKVKDDVRELGKVVGVKVNCATSNSFNLLTRDGRREWRAAGGIDKQTGSVEGVEGVEGEF
jgi:hypothetical protein